MPSISTTENTDLEAGNLLGELERRQDEVLEQLDALDAKIRDVLSGLGVAVEDDVEEQTGNLGVDEHAPPPAARAA